ncbi:MAG TPA: terminase large subunit, partial [Thermomicrobiales bacterium]|nr:terminase large subunit [Thermomicrobiales bacterium]
MSAAAERRVGPGLVYPGQPEPRRVKLGGREFWSTGWHVIAVIHSHCVCTNGEWIGRPAKLQPWQQRLLWRLFEVEVGADGHWVRRYRRALLGIARKNGKTELAAWLTLYFLLFDGEQSPQIFCGANSEEQADLVFGAAKLCAEHSPTLK